MSRHQFTYCVVRYTPDPGAGERLNVGVLLFMPQTREMVWKFEDRYERLSSAFAGFNGKLYRAHVSRLGQALERARQTSERILLHETSHKSALDVLLSVIADEDLCLSISRPRGGVTADIHREMAMLYDRMVLSPRPHKPEASHRSDEQVWRSVFEPALPADVKAELRPHTFRTPDVEVSFDHAFKNGSWHVVQPISLDFKTPEKLRKRASEWAGNSLGLQNAQGLGKIYFLLGAPAEPGVQEAYKKAKRLLDKSPVVHEIVEEKDAAQFAEHLTELVRQHG